MFLNSLRQITKWSIYKVSMSNLVLPEVIYLIFYLKKQEKKLKVVTQSRRPERKRH